MLTAKAETQSFICNPQDHVTGGIIRYVGGGRDGIDCAKPCIHVTRDIRLKMAGAEELWSVQTADSHPASEGLWKMVSVHLCGWPCS